MGFLSQIFAIEVVPQFSQLALEALHLSPLGIFPFSLGLDPVLQALGFVIQLAKCCTGIIAVSQLDLDVHGRVAR